MQIDDEDLVTLDPALLSLIAELVEGVEPLTDEEMEAWGEDEDAAQ